MHLQTKNLFLEIPARWHQALRAEYAGDFQIFSFIIFPPIARPRRFVVGLRSSLGVIESPERLRMYYYDIGEPSLPYLPDRASRPAGCSPGQPPCFNPRRNYRD
jgi:hypothetical protein